MARFLTDGFKALVSFQSFPGSVAVMKEREVQPPDLDAGGEIETSTMRNSRYRTKAPKSLVTAGDVTLQIQYDPAIYDGIVAMLGRNQLIAVTFPDGTSVIVWGWLDKFTPASLKEGDFPMAEIKIHCSNQNNSGIEVAPVYNSTVKDITALNWNYFTS